MRWLKKAQNAGAGGAAFLILLIAVLIILYVLFLPPEDRAALLGEENVGVGLNGDGQPSVPTGTHSKHRVFAAVPEVHEDQGLQTKKLPTFTVKTSTSGNILAARQNMRVERSAFHDGADQIVFTVPDASENLLLTFSAFSGTGELIIELNGQVIYKSILTSRQGPAVTLPKSLLLQPTNTLTFRASPVGFAVWKTNTFDLVNVKVSADVTSFEDARQKHRFVIDELEAVKTAQLQFFPECFETAGKLTLELNHDIIYTGKPECETDFTVDIALSRLTEDENTLSWSVSEGRYIVSDVHIVIDREIPETIETFTISPDILNRVASTSGAIELSMTFANQGSEGVIELNGEELAFRTHKTSFSGGITSRVKPGENTIRIVDSTTPITLIEVFVS